MNDALVELREASPGKLVLRGYASVSERWYPVGRMFEEKVTRGAWRRSLANEPDTVLLEDHDGLGLARTRTPSGDPSLLLSETDRGLFAEAFLDATAPRVQNLRSTAENCGLQMSVAFTCSKDNWNQDRSRRELIEANINRGDVTVCNFGANEAATATISTRGKSGEAERRAFAESLKGSRERRMCPDLEAYELESGSTLTVAKGRSQIAVPRGDTSVEWAKARRAKLAGGKRPRPVTGRYAVERAKATRAKLNRPRSSRALGDLVLSPFGPDWEIDSARDVHKAVLAVEVGHARGRNEDGIKAWVFKRAVDLGIPEMVPAGWKGDWTSGATESVAGQQQ